MIVEKSKFITVESRSDLPVWEAMLFASDIVRRGRFENKDPDKLSRYFGRYDYKDNQEIVVSSAKDNPYLIYVYKNEKDATR